MATARGPPTSTSVHPPPHTNQCKKNKPKNFRERERETSKSGKLGLKSNLSGWEYSAGWAEMKACGTRTPIWPPLEILNTESAKSTQAIQRRVTRARWRTRRPRGLHYLLVSSLFPRWPQPFTPPFKGTVTPPDFRSSLAPLFWVRWLQSGLPRYVGALTLTGCRRTPRSRSTDMAVHTCRGFPGSRPSGHVRWAGLARARPFRPWALGLQWLTLHGFFNLSRSMTGATFPPPP